MDKNKVKKIVTFLGKLLGIFGVLFVVYTLSQEYTLDSFSNNFVQLLNIMPLLIVLNVLSSLLGIYAWHIMLLHYAQKSFPYLASYYYFAKTEISKYLPGNVFHFVGRQVLASKMGITQKEMAKTSFLFSFLLLAGTVFSSTILAFFSGILPLYLILLSGLASIILIIVIIFLYPSFPMRKKLKMNFFLAVSVAMQGLMLGTIMLYQSTDMSTAQFYLFVSIYIVSWLIGFITPGASGGLGVREGAFIAISTFLNINISADIIIFSVLMVRLVNIVIDIIMYLSTYVLAKKMKVNEG